MQHSDLQLPLYCACATMGAQALRLQPAQPPASLASHHLDGTPLNYTAAVVASGLVAAGVACAYDD